MTSVTTRPGTGRDEHATDPTTDPPEASATELPRADLRGARTRPGSSRLLWVLTAVAFVAALAVAATLGRSAWADRQDADNRAAALAAGKQLAVNFVTMDAATFDRDTARVLSGATGSFRTEYAATLPKLEPVVTSNKTVSRVERAEAALVSADEDSAKVVVGVVAPTTNAATTTPEKKTYRLRLDLVKVGDEWKVSSLDFVS